MAVNGAKYIDGHYVCTFIELHRKYGNANGLPISDIKENRQYTITMSGYVDYFETKYAGLVLIVEYMDGEYEYTGEFTNDNEKTVKVTTKSNKTVSSIKMSYGTGSNRNAYISHLKIEEGAISSQPVTSDKIVDISENKTLYAEWKKK